MMRWGIEFTLVSQLILSRGEKGILSKLGSPNLRREAYAPAIVRRRLTQIPGERPTNVGDIAIVSRRRSAATTHRCVSPGRFIVIRILYDYRQPSRAEIVRFGSDFEICVGWNGILD